MGRERGRTRNVIFDKEKNTLRQQPFYGHSTVIRLPFYDNSTAILRQYYGGPRVVVISSYECRKFGDLSPEDKAKRVKELELCPVCLGTGHGPETCATRQGCHECSQRHHTMLHGVPLHNQSS